MFKNILVPVDGSDYSYHAARMALTIAEMFNSRITLLHVVDLSIISACYPGGAVLPAITEAMTEEWRHNGELVLKGALELFEDTEVETLCELTWGNPAQIIAEKARDNCELVILGSRGKGGLSEFLLGSVSSRVSHTVGCPVLLIKG